MKVEVRIPTYRRPVLLQRALESLQAQTHLNWVARVFDDSPSREAQAVCEKLMDSRIIYEPNPVNLGICLNIDRAFGTPPLSGSAFLCVLEDDNYLLEDYLKDNISALLFSQRDVLLRNQRIEEMRTPEMPGPLRDGTMFDSQYCDGVISQSDFLASFFFSTGANNSSLFWRSDADLCFSTVRYLKDVVSQERLRSLCIDRDIVIAMKPLVVWRDNREETLRPMLNTALKWRLEQIRLAADERAIYRALFKYLSDMGCVDRIFQALDQRNKHCERVLWRVGIQVPAQHRRLSTVDRTIICMKRRLARVVSLLIFYEPHISFDLDRKRLKEKP